MIESHLTNLELSKQLKELGIKQNSIFYWNNFKTFISPEKHWLIFDSIHSKENCSAFLSTELGEMLPICLGISNREYTFLCKRFGSDHWTASYVPICTDDEKNKYIAFSKIDELEQNAKAKLLIHLIENNLVTDEWKREWLV